MAAGDVTVQIIDKPVTEASIDTVITSMRNTANDHWLSTELNDQLVIINIEEA